MQALGLIETRGLVVAVESADAMLKAAEVTLVEKTYVGGGLVSIAVTGDVAAVKAAVEAGASAVKQKNSTLLISQHVIPRPHEEVDGLVRSVTMPENVKIKTVEAVQTEPEDKEVENEIVEGKVIISLETDLEKLNKNKIDNIVLEYGLTEVLEVLNKLKVTRLRKLAREYKKLKIAGRLISKADKKTLLAEFKEYYED